MSTVNSLKKKCRHLEEKGRWKDLSKAYNDIGRLLRGDKKYDEALDYYVLDRDLCRKHQDIIEEAEATRMIGEVYVEQGRFTEGLKHHKQYLSMAIQLQNRVSEQRALATLSWTYLAWSTAEPSRLAKALQYSQKSHAAVARIASKDVDRSERAQMTGRAAENIGKINWRLGDVSEAEESFCEAETSYRGYRHWEDLHRLAVTRAGLVLDTGAEAELGRALAQCRVSLEAAHKLRDPASAEANVDSLVTMFKVHLSMKQFDDARDCLVKARHHSKEDKNVIHHLKMMTVISDSVKIILSGNSDQVTHRPYEQIADALVKFEGSLGEKQRIFKIALEYYTIAFSRASNEGSMECLPDLNNSIAQTYDDIRDYDNALSFFEKQLELERDRSAAERCVTLSNIAMVRENMASGYEVVMEARRRWLDLATTSNNKGQMLAALLEMFRYQKDSGHLQEAEDTRIRIESSGGSVEDADTASSSQRSSCSDVSDKFPEISLEDADEAPRVSTSRIARRTPAEFTRRNNKGESPLHVEIQRVRQENKIISMIERGHPLETEDNAGWTPLGEAVGRMNISYVRIIAEAGANIDHKNHEWETPLIAACQKGFLDGVEYLLERGAKVSVKTKRGVTALGYLKNHLLEGRRPACDPDYKRPGVMERLEAAVVKMETMLTKLGLSTEVQLPLEQDSPSLEDELDDFDHTLTEDSNAPDGPIFCSTQRNRIRSPSPSSESSLPSLPSSPAAVSRSPLKATQIYQDAINSLRSSARPAAQPLAPRPAARNTRGAEECLDDWLVDDMKRAESKNKRKKPDTGDTDRSEGGVKKQKNIENENPVEDLTLSPTLKTSRNRLSLTRRKSNSKQPKISSLLTRSRTPSPLLPELPPTPAPPSVPSAPAPAAVTCVKVTVASETFLVPVPDPQLTVEWLAQEAAARYCRSLGSEPVLQLRTEDGAALDPRDPLGFIIANFKCIAADVLHWKCKPASEKYRDACRDLGQPSFKNITEKLSSMSSTNALSLRLPLRGHHARPLLSSLRGNLALRDLDLSRCKLEDGVVAQLGPVLPTLPHLASLDLSNNLLTSASISTLAAVSSPSLNKLSVSGNMLDDYCLRSLTSVLESSPALATLLLSRCSLTRNLFQADRLGFSAALRQSKLKHLDVSHNNLGPTGLQTLLTSLPACLQKLNVSGCNLKSASTDPITAGLMAHCSRGSPDCDLASLNISSLNLTDSGVDKLVSSLQYCGRLTTLHLDHNLLTAAGLAAVMKAVLAQSVPLTSLSCAASSPDLFWSDKQREEEIAARLKSLLASNCSRLEVVVMPRPPEGRGTGVTRVWDNFYESRSKHRRDGLGNLELSVE